MGPRNIVTGFPGNGPSFLSTILDSHGARLKYLCLVSRNCHQPRKPPSNHHGFLCTACCSFTFPLFLKLGCLLQIGVYEKRHDDIRVYEVRRRATGSAAQRNPFSILQLRESSGAYRQVRAQPVQCKGKHMSSTLQDIFAV